MGLVTSPDNEGLSGYTRLGHWRDGQLDDVGPRATASRSVATTPPPSPNGIDTPELALSGIGRTAGDSTCHPQRTSEGG